MRRTYLLILSALAVLCMSAAAPAGTGTYYKAADGKKGAALKSALRDIVQTTTELNYGELWECFRTTDKRSDGKVWDMYSNKTNYVFGSSAQGANYSGEGDSYNREHSFPQSWFGGSIKPMYTDLHHMYPTDGFVNNQRGNLPFGEVASPTYSSAGGFSKVGYCSYSGYTGKVFEPNDEYKGDFARTYFYMVTRYEEKLSDWYQKNSESRATIDGSAYPAFTSWQLKMLLEWAAADPVSQKEVARNNAVKTLQGNRNPFIDYPGLEQYIWGSKKADAFSYDNYVQPDGSSSGSGEDNGNDPDPIGDQTTAGTYRLTITADDFNTTSYAANNNEKTSTAFCTTDETKTFEVKWTSYQVFKSGGMQWQKNAGCIYNTTDLGTIGNVTITSSAGTFTTYYGTSARPSSSMTAGGGFFQIKVGSATGKTSKIEIVFTIAGGDTPGPGPGPGPGPDPTPDTYGWVETPIGNITATDVFVIVGTHSQGTFALPNEGKSKPEAVPVTIEDSKLTSEVTDNLLWNIGSNDAGGYIFYPNGSTTKWLFCNTTASSSDNENLRVGTGSRRVFEISEEGYLVTRDSYTPRYACVYCGLEWRGYIKSVLKETTIKFYKRVAQDEDGLTLIRSQRKGTVFNLAGQQIVNGQSVKGTLPKGIYIVDGKKRVIGKR